MCAVAHLAFIKPLDLELLSKLRWQVNLKLSERQRRKVAIGGSLPGARRESGVGVEELSGHNATTVPRCGFMLRLNW